MKIYNALHKFISNKLGDDFEKNFEQALGKELGREQSSEELCQNLLTEFRTILSHLHICRPHTVKITENDPHTLIIDGKTYELDALFSHNDLQASECMAAVDALFCDLRRVSTNIRQDISNIENTLCAQWCCDK